MTKPPPTKVSVTKGLPYAGHENEDLNIVLVEQVASTLWALSTQPEGIEKAITAAIIQLREIKAGDVIEGMIAAQMIASHSAALECYRRAMLKEQTTQARAVNLSQANKSSRTFAALLEALNRHRGKGQPQVVRVERVTVEAGGQAVVGNVSTGGRGSSKAEGQPHEQYPPAVTHAPGRAVLGDVEAHAEPVPRARRQRA